jgi:beta propeller repeat protein
MMTTGIVAAGSETNSVIYKDQIVWQDESNGNWDIQMYNISTSTKTQITSDKADQQNPEIYGKNIVWQDSRNGGINGDSWDPSGNWDIYTYNISTQKETQITKNGSTQLNPAIYGDKLVWQDSRNGNWEIYMYNFSTSTETQITHNSSDQTSPDIYEDRIVWVEEAKISMYNLTTSKETRISQGPGWELDFESDPSIYKDKIVCSAETISTNYIVKVYDLTNSTENVISSYDAHSSSPDIYEDRVVWIDDRNMIDIGQKNDDIFILNLSTSIETQITTNKSNQVNPAIYGNTIVWTDERNAVTYNDMSDIYMYNLSTSKETRITTTVAEEQRTKGAETRITTNKGEQEYPAIYGDRIVWRDWRNGNQHDFKNGDIYMYNVSTSKEIQITTNKSSQVNPDIYKDIIVWEDDRNGSENWDIYMYNLSTKKETQITANKSNQLSPAIYGDKIVWVDQRNGYPNNDIYMYDLSTRKETQITTNGSNQQSPKIYGDRIVWEDWRNGDDYNLNSDIYMHDLSISKEIQITTDKSYQGEPAIYGDIIGWTDQRRNGNWDIYMYNLSTFTETQVPTRGGEEKHVSDINGDRILWDEIRMLNRNWSIYMYNLSTSTEAKILGGTNTGQGYPKLYGDRIVWTDTRNGNPDIYMFTLQGTEPTGKPPISDFSATPLSGKAPLKVKFTSISKGSPTAWKWNFGDGSLLSTEKNPEHIYSKAGVYTVKHTAINAYGRDTEIKTKYVNAQVQLKAPVAAFSASPRSGKVPLKVRFTDKSLNSPVSWKWSFGDGTYSTARNPVHAYSKAGKYNVSLTVKNAKGKNTEMISGYIVVSKK